MLTRPLLASLLLLPSLPAGAQKQPQSSPKATVLRATTIYLQGTTSSQKLSTVAPGREMALLGPANDAGGWVHVYANTDQEVVSTEDQPVFTDKAAAQPISGWVQAQNVVTSQTPQGQAILFGQAVSQEHAASAPHPPADAALDARRLYRMAAQLFPQSPRTPEAAWRSADIRWQLQKEDAATLPSAHEKESYLRRQPDENEMKHIEKIYPGTKWASFAAYELIDNKLCGDWQGSEQCPEKEAGYYAGFADKYPDSPRAPQALFEAAWRLACAGDMWVDDDKQDRAKNDRDDAVSTAQHLLSKYADTDYAARGASLIYKVQQGIPVYGSPLK